MTDTDLLDRLRGYFHTGEIPIGTPDCLDAEIVGALADGTLKDPARAQALAHMTTCAFCRRAVASVAAALADGPATHEIEAVEGRTSRRRRPLWIALSLAAAASVLLLLRAPTNDMNPIHRGGVNQSTVPVPIRPVGVVAGPPVFVWKSALSVDRYRLTLFDTRGDVLYETQVFDTTAALPDSIPLGVAQLYLWKVEARTGFDRWVSSTLVEFSIAARSP